MVTFDINVDIVEFDEKTDNYNSIRKSFKNQAEYARDNFKNYCLDNILTLKDLSEKSLEIGMYNIESTIKKGVETLVGYNLITIDINTFKECYCEKYLKPTTRQIYLWGRFLYAIEDKQGKILVVYAHVIDEKRFDY